MEINEKPNVVKMIITDSKFLKIKKLTINIRIRIIGRRIRYPLKTSSYIEYLKGSTPIILISNSDPRLKSLRYLNRFFV